MTESIVLSSSTYDTTTAKFGQALNGGTGTLSGTFTTATTNFAFEAWGKMSGAPGAIQVLLGAVAYEWIGVAANGTVTGSNGTSGTSITSSVSVVDGNWHHFAVNNPASGGGNVTFYVDGVSVGTLAPTTMTTDGDFGIRQVGSSGQYIWSGEIDEVAIWSTAKYPSAFTPPSSAYTGSEANLMGAWPLDGNGNAIGGGTSQTLVLAPVGNGISGHPLQITGKYTGTAPIGIDYSLNSGLTWTAASSPTISGGTFSFSFTAPSAGSYTIEVREEISTPVISGSKSFIIAVSSSNSTNALSSLYTTSLYNWTPSTQLTHFATALAAVVAGTAGARCPILCIGDSTTAGYGSVPANTDWRAATSYPSRLTQWLINSGFAAQNDNFFGYWPLQDSRITLIGGAQASCYNTNGGYFIYTTNIGDGVDYTLLKPTTYDRVDVFYDDNSASSGLSVAVDGGSVIETISITGATGAMKKTTVTLPNSTHSVVNLRATNNVTTIQITGIALWNSTVPAIEVLNAGIPGAQSSIITVGSTTYGVLAASLLLNPSLALINYGINDINQQQSASASASNIEQLISALKAQSCDSISIIPNPFYTNYYAAGMVALRSAIQGNCTTNNVGLVDLDLTYNSNWSSLNSAGYMFDNLHPNGTLYNDIAYRLNALITASPST